MWCLKEAYRKAVGGSVLYVDPRELCMVSYAESPSRFYPPDKSLQVFTHFDLQAWSVVLYYNNIN